MKIIVGLGNPGEKYKHTRHNAGWMILDRFVLDKEAEKRFFAGLGIGNAKWETKFDCKLLEASIDNQKVLFVKPFTFMNESGAVVAKIINFYKADVSKDLLIIHDDSDLPFENIRTTNSSSSAGHKGVQDVIDKLGTQDFHRIRIGVESRPPLHPPLNQEGNGGVRMPTDAFVLQNFTDDELKKIKSEISPKVKEEMEKFLAT